MALLTGMRNGELHALEWSDVDFENSKISVNKSYNTRFKVVKSTKAGYWRTVPISSELRSLLAVLKVDSERIGRRQVLPRLTTWTLGFQARELRRFCNGIGLPSIRFHTLRACFSTQLIRSGVPPIQIQKICGWRDLKTMQRYIRLAGIEIEGATEALKVLPVEEVSERAAEMFAAPAPVAATPPAVLK
jgi:integrase